MILHFVFLYPYLSTCNLGMPIFDCQKIVKKWFKNLTPFKEVLLSEK